MIDHQTAKYLATKAKELFPNAQDIKIKAIDEDIFLIIDRKTYTCEAGSDDDAFDFAIGEDTFSIPFEEYGDD